MCAFDVGMCVCVCAWAVVEWAVVTFALLLMSHDFPAFAGSSSRSSQSRSAELFFFPFGGSETDGLARLNLAF